MGNKVITPQELVRDISQTAERIGAERGLSDEQILKLKLAGAAMFSDFDGPKGETSGVAVTRHLRDKP
jgi:hypothetical protein